LIWVVCFTPRPVDCQGNRGLGEP